MTKRGKAFREILEHSKASYSLGEIDRFLQYYGFQCTSPRSSHFVYRRGDCPHIVIVAHTKKLKRVYVERLVKILCSYDIISSHHHE